jgi:hypothetical protein
MFRVSVAKAMAEMAGAAEAVMRDTLPDLERLQLLSDRQAHAQECVTLLHKMTW